MSRVGFEPTTHGLKVRAGQFAAVRGRSSTGKLGRIEPLVGSLSFARKPESWGAYFRQSPIAISKEDFDVLEDAITAAESTDE